MDVINHPNLADHILRAINASRDGLQVDKLEEGTKLTVETMNSVYEIKILETDQPLSVEISGGSLRDGNVRYEESVPVYFVGSTFGGSMLKMNWIGKGMCMEFADNDRVLTTSPVQNVEIEAPDGSWGYSMDWTASGPE